MRFTAILPVLCAIAALVLSFLCIFAGSRTGFLQNADILTLNTSMIGASFNTSSTSSSFINGIEGDVAGRVNGAINDIAKAIDIHDFYSAHILDYCEGYYSPTAVANKTSQPTKNVTRCSNQTALFHFDPTAILQSELRSGVTLSDLNWPSSVQNAVRAVAIASQVMFILYCIGAAFAGLAIIGAIIGLLNGGRLSAILNFLLDFLAFICLGIASAISTVIASKVVSAVRTYGQPIGIAAYKGKTFMGMTWAATALMLMAASVWIFEFCVGRRRQATFVREGKEGRL